MRYVIIRDDDTNAFTPVECLERLYRPFLKRGLPVNLAVIPEVSTHATKADGDPEGFLVFRNGSTEPTVPIGAHRELVAYLKANPGYHVLQHGCHHDYLEFECSDVLEVRRRLELGSQRLQEAGLGPTRTFVAPYDKFSRVSLGEVAGRFQVISSGWYELGRLPRSWWPRYALKKLRGSPHWKVGQTWLLSHPGCLLSCHRTYSRMLEGIMHYLETQPLTVLVTHWWEYFRDGQPDESFIQFLHETAGYLASHPGLKVIPFADLAGRSRL
jgi:hypothetical protein